MALIVLAAINLGLLTYGIRRILEELRNSGLPAFFIVIAEEDDYLEGMLRYLVRQVRREETVNPLVVGYERCGPHSRAIAEKCAFELSFPVREINMPDNPLNYLPGGGQYLLDLRERESREEKLCLIRLFLRRYKYLAA